MYLFMGPLTFFYIYCFMMQTVDGIVCGSKNKETTARSKRSENCKFCEIIRGLLFSKFTITNKREQK